MVTHSQIFESEILLECIFHILGIIEFLKASSFKFLSNEVPKSAILSPIKFTNLQLETVILSKYSSLNLIF